MKLCIVLLVFAFLSFPSKSLTMLGSNKSNLLAFGDELVRRGVVLAKSAEIKREPVHDRVILLEYVFQVQQLMDELKSTKNELVAESVAHKLARVEYHLSMLLQNYYSNMQSSN